MSHRIEGTVALVSGANRGIGRAIVEALVARGAARVYAGARDPRALDTLAGAHVGRVVPLALDVTDEASVMAAAVAAADVQLLVNNAGVATMAPLLEPAAAGALERDLAVNVYGLLRVSQAFAPTLVAARGTLVNLASIASLVNYPLLPTYSISKAATHSLTQALRAVLSSQGVHVLGVYPGPIDTEMARDIPFDKTSPAECAAAILDAVEAGEDEVFPDAMSKGFGSAYYADARALERQLTGRAAA